jgi:hypothetical protein
VQTRSRLPYSRPIKLKCAYALSNRSDQEN